MAEDNIDDILVRLDEIEKLQAKLRRVIPRAASSTSRHAGNQDLSRDSSSSIRFPSLFTFPVISNFPSPPSHDRVQKSAAQLNLNNRLSSDSRASTANLRNANRPSKNKSLVKETSGRNPLLLNASSTAANSKKATLTPYLSRSITSRTARDLYGVIRKGSKDESSKTAVRDKTQRATGEKSNMRLPENGNNASSIRSSVQTSHVQAEARGKAESRGIWSCLRRKRHRDRNGVSTGTLVERIMEKLNYCFVDDKRVTVPYHHPGSTIPRRVHVSRAPMTEGTEALRMHVSTAKISVN